MSDAILGQLLDVSAARDAIHIAIAPTIAAHTMIPGQHVGLLPDGRASAKSVDKTVGIVDPFLKAAVGTGQRFWLCLYQKTVTGMRHEWSHPAFPVAEAPMPSDGRLSEAWLKDYVRQHCYYWENEPDGGYGEFLRYVECNRWIYYYGSDCHGLSDVDDADELFRHLSVVLGRRIDAAYFEAFTCSC